MRTASTLVWSWLVLAVALSSVKTFAATVHVATIADLRARTGNANQDEAHVQGYYAQGDGGGGVFYFNSSSTDSDNGGTVIAPTGIPPSGRWHREKAAPLNVKWFGAKGDGSTNDAIALQKALDTSGNLFFPAGVYIIAVGPHYPMAGLRSADKSVFLRGEGMADTELRFGRQAYALSFENTSGAHRVEIRDMSLTTTQSLGGTAIHVDWPTGWSNRQINKGGIFNVEIRGADIQSHGWSEGINIWQGQEFQLYNVSLVGKDSNEAVPSQADGTLSGNAIRWSGSEYPTELRLLHCTIWNWQNGLNVSGHSEGIYVGPFNLYRRETWHPMG
jgi:hypothetical protein